MPLSQCMATRLHSVACKCRLRDGSYCYYTAAFPLNSEKRIAPSLKFIGVGIIVSIDNTPQKINTELKFYILKRGRKYNGYYEKTDGRRTTSTKSIRQKNRRRITTN